MTVFDATNKNIRQKWWKTLKMKDYFGVSDLSVSIYEVILVRKTLQSSWDTIQTSPWTTGFYGNMLPQVVFLLTDVCLMTGWSSVIPPIQHVKRVAFVPYLLCCESADRVLVFGFGICGGDPARFGTLGPPSYGLLLFLTSLTPPDPTPSLSVPSYACATKDLQHFSQCLSVL